MHAYIYIYIQTYIHPNIHPSIHPSIHTYIHTYIYIQCTELPGVRAKALDKYSDLERASLLPTPTMRRQGDYL